MNDELSVGVDPVLDHSSSKRIVQSNVTCRSVIQYAMPMYAEMGRQETTSPPLLLINLPVVIILANWMKMIWFFS
jgi:hypothetical protein